MKNKPKPASRPKKQPESPFIKTPAVKAALLGKKKKPVEKTDKKKIGTLDNAKLRKMERELRETKERLRLLTEATEEGIAIHDNGVIIDANDALARIFGYELSEIIGMKAERLATPETWKVIRKHIATKYNKPYEGVGVRKDGSTFICSLVGKPYKYKGRTLRLSTFHDINERKKAEEALRESEEKYRLIFMYSPLGLLYFNGKGVIVACNDNFVQIIGSSQEKLIGLNMLNLPDKSLVLAVQKALSGSHGLYEGIYSSVTAKKNTPVRCLFAPMNVEGGNIQGGVGIIEDITQRKLAEDKLADEHRQLNYILDATKTRIDIIDSNFNLRYVDDSWQKIYGDPTGRKCYEYFMERKSPCDNCGIPKALDSRQVVVTEEVLIREGNRAIEVHTIPFQNKEGEWLVAEFNIDISVRKESEEALRESENKYRLLTEKISDIVWIQDMDLRTIYVTPSIQTVLGFTPEERMNQTVEEQLTPDSLSFVLEAMAKELALEKQMNTDPQKYVTFVLEFYHKDGSTRWLEAVLSGLRNDQGVLTGIHGVGRDITERKEAEEALKRTQLLNEAILESVPGILYLYDDTGHLVHWNKQHEILTGYSGDEIKGRYILDWFGGVEPDTSDIKKGIFEATTTGYSTGEGHLITKNGNSIFMFFTGSKLSIAGKDHLLGIGVDITERKKAEEELKIYREHLEELVRERTIKLEAANNELEAFSYSASHDLRAPLRSIDGFSQALLEDCEGKLDIQGKDYLIRIRAAIRRMAELIEDLLQLSRITRTEMDMEKVNLTRIARLLIDELQKSQPQRIVDTRIAEGMEETADSKLMRIVLENLLGNAWKFTEKQAKALIEFGCTKKGKRKVYFIRDNGVGFDMDYADKLFAPFQRLHTEEEFPGTGIGLATVRRIIHRHGGKIWTEGQTGKGATFYFSLNEK